MTFLGVESTPGSLFVLGSLVETVGDRILFFPGFVGRHLEHHFNRRSRRPHPVDATVDHLTFEIARRRGHYTRVLPSGRRRIVPGIPQRRREVGPNIVGWFGITARSFDALEPLPRRLWIAGECPASDRARRIRLLQGVSGAIVLPVPWPPAGSFVQVNFFVDLEPTRALGKVTTFIPIGPPELRQPTIANCRPIPTCTPFRFWADRPSSSSTSTFVRACLPAPSALVLEAKRRVSRSPIREGPNDRCSSALLK